MAGSYNRSVKRTIGGGERQGDGNFLITQSQHLTATKDFYFASEMMGRVVKLAYGTGNFERGIGSAGFQDGEFDVPSGVAEWQGKLLVTNLNGGNLQTFNFDGTYQQTIGSQGDGPLQFSKPTSVAVDENNNIYVAELGNKRIQVLDSQLKHKQDIKLSLNGITYISYDQQHKRLLASDSDGNKVSLVSLDGKETASIADVGSAPGQITYPCGTAVDSKGNILVSDYVNNRVQVFDSNGKFVSLLGPPDAGLQWPVDVCVVGDEISVMDGDAFQGWNRISVF